MKCTARVHKPPHLIEPLYADEREVIQIIRRGPESWKVGPRMCYILNMLRVVMFALQLSVGAAWCPPHHGPSLNTLVRKVAFIPRGRSHVSPKNYVAEQMTRSAPTVTREAIRRWRDGGDVEAGMSSTMKPEMTLESLGDKKIWIQKEVNSVNGGEVKLRLPAELNELVLNIDETSTSKVCGEFKLKVDVWSMSEKEREDWNERRKDAKASCGSIESGTASTNASITSRTLNINQMGQIVDSEGLVYDLQMGQLSVNNANRDGYWRENEVFENQGNDNGTARCENGISNVRVPNHVR